MLYGITGWVSRAVISPLSLSLANFTTLIFFPHIHSQALNTGSLIQSTDHILNTDTTSSFFCVLNVMTPSVQRPAFCLLKKHLRGNSNNITSCSVMHYFQTWSSIMPAGYRHRMAPMVWWRDLATAVNLRGQSQQQKEGLPNLSLVPC